MIRWNGAFLPAALVMFYSLLSSGCYQSGYYTSPQYIKYTQSSWPFKGEVQNFLLHLVKAQKNDDYQRMAQFALQDYEVIRFLYGYRTVSNNDVFKPLGLGGVNFSIRPLINKFMPKNYVLSFAIPNDWERYDPPQQYSRVARELQRYITNTAQESRKDIRQSIHQLIDGIEISNLDYVQLLLSPDQGIPQHTRSQQVVRRIIPYYFQTIAYKEKLDLVENILKMPLGSSDEDRLVLLFKKSGPAVQKLLQLYGQDVQNENIRNALRALQNELTPFSDQDVQDVMARVFSPDERSRILDFEMKPLHAGSVAQVHRAHAIIDGEDKIIFIKLRRPGYLEAVKDDFKKVRPAFKDNSSELSILDDMEASILKEGDLPEEAHQIQIMGGIYNDSTAQIGSVKLAPGFSVAADGFVMLEAPGKTVKSYLNQKTLSAPLREDLKEKLKVGYTQWLLHIFKPGQARAFHGDPHAGNLHYVEQTGELIYLDWGVVVTMTPQEVTLFSEIAALSLFAPDTVSQIVDRLVALQPETPNSQQQLTLTKNVTAVLEKEGTQTDKLQNLYAAALDAGVPLAPSFTSFLRAALLWEGMIRAIQPQTPNQAVSEILNIYTDVFVNHVLKVSEDCEVTLTFN